MHGGWFVVVVIEIGMKDWKGSRQQNSVFPVSYAKTVEAAARSRLKIELPASGD